jgi:hypothetical protein
MKKRHRVAQHNYVRTLAYLRKIGALPNGYHEVTVDHDDWCGHWQGKRCAELKLVLGGIVALGSPCDPPPLPAQALGHGDPLAPLERSGTRT